MKRLTAALLALASFALVGNAFALDPPTFQVVKMRNTSASSVAQQTNWATTGTSPSGFLDSLVFRRAAATATVYDTSVAFLATQYPLPPNIVNNSAALSDTLMPWILVRVRQDSVRTATDPLLFSGTSGMDSIRIAVEHSPDGGRTWFSCAGTPTTRFDVVYMTSGQDGLQSPTLIGVESSPGEDSAIIPFKAAYPRGGNVYITNTNLPYIGEYLRFIVGMDASGQFELEVAGWPNRPADQY